MVPKNEELRAELNIPKIYSSLIARRQDNYSHLSDRVTRTTYQWFVTMLILGPDGRFNPGRAELSASAVRETLAALIEASKVLNQISRRSFASEYTQFVTPIHSNPSVQVRSQDNVSAVRVYLLSRALREFSVDLNKNELMQMIDILASCPKKGNELLSQLRPEVIENPAEKYVKIVPLTSVKVNESVAELNPLSGTWWKFWK